MCNEVGKYPGAAVNFAMMNEPSMPGDDITQLKIDFINILAGGTVNDPAFFTMCPQITQKGGHFFFRFLHLKI